MKINLLFLISIPFLIISCKDSHKLSFKTYDFESATCKNCPEITVSFPEFNETSIIGKTINNNIKEEIITLLNYDDEINTNSIEKASEAFKNAYQKLIAKFANEATTWEASAEGKILFEDENIISIELNSYVFTGGAHGYNAIRYLNFDKKKETVLENWELFKDKDSFLKFIETKFRIQEKIAQDQSINSTGFMFEDDTFHLPENIGFTKKGIQFIYNQYEVASYADGPITITIPYNEANTYLATKIEAN